MQSAPTRDRESVFWCTVINQDDRGDNSSALRRKKGVAESSLCYTPQSLQMFWSETELFAPALLRLRFGQKRLARQAELARLAINLDELHLDFVTDTEIVFDLLYALPVKLGDV